MKKSVNQSVTNIKGVPNQIEVSNSVRREFWSYGTLIAIIEAGMVTLDRRHWDCSNTTGKYRNIFLEETKKETEQKIKEGQHLLDDLN